MRTTIFLCLAVIFTSCSADKKPSPPGGYSYCSYCDGTGYDSYILGGIISEECTACFGSGYIQNSPSFKSSHAHIDEKIPWNECDICGLHKVYW